MKSLPLRALSDAERLVWLRLARSENVGPVTFRQLIQRFGTPEAALEALPELARHGGRKRPIRIAPRADVEAEAETLARFGASLIALSEPAYPAALAAIDDAPPLISLKGNPGLLDRPAAALVGARNASANGRLLAARLAADLAEAGFLVVSGLARGIDTAAHAAALDGGTLAVMAGGIDIVYPPQNRELYEAIAARGLLLSEQPPGIAPQARHFPRRNRLISGLSLGVVVVEAAERSGSLITARMAGEQGREVFAVPGSPLDPRARGCNLLLRQGATLVESAADVIEALAAQIPPAREPLGPDFHPPANRPPPESEVAKARREIAELLGPTAVSVDELLRQCQFSPAIVSLVLLELELAGRLDRHAGNRVSLAVGSG